MAKRYLGGGVSFEQKDVYQEFSEDEGGGGGSTTLSGLTDVDISNPTDGQTLVYNATTGKWENGAGGGANLVMPNINITMTAAETGTATCDMTRAAIVAAIENGAICIGRIIRSDRPVGCYQFATDVEVNVGDGMLMQPSVIFKTYALVGGGGVVWCAISVFDDEVDVFFDHTASYPGE